MLGLVDWGIGGIGVYKLIKEQLGSVPVLYFSDTGATPYGKMSRRTLIQRLDTVIDFLRHRGATHILIGCNAASTAIDDLGYRGLPITGVIEPAVDLVTRIKPKRLGLIGGRRTVVSGAYRKRLAGRSINVEQRIAQPLSALIETGDTGSEELRAEAHRIIGPLRKCSHILLACTHYPAIGPVLQTMVSDETELIDPAHELVKTVRKWRIAGSKNDVFLTTGDPDEMRRAALAAFGVRISKPRQVSV